MVMYFVDKKLTGNKNMEFNFNDAIDVLNRTPKILREMLRGISLEMQKNNEGGETWSPYDVIGHLIHGEKTDWITRTKIILENGQEKPFNSFDRFAQFEESKGKSLEELLDLFENLRKENLQILTSMSLTKEDLAKTGKHPDLGIVTLEQLLSTWVAHDLDHIVQISRTMAKQYRDLVGPWRAYLSVMR